MPCLTSTRASASGQLAACERPPPRHATEQRKGNRCGGGQELEGAPGSFAVSQHGGEQPGDFGACWKSVRDSQRGPVPRVTSHQGRGLPTISVPSCGSHTVTPSSDRADQMGSHFPAGESNRQSPPGQAEPSTRLEKVARDSLCSRLTGCPPPSARCKPSLASPKPPVLSC